MDGAKDSLTARWSQIVPIAPASAGSSSRPSSGGSVVDAAASRVEFIHLSVDGLHAPTAPAPGAWRTLHDELPSPKETPWERGMGPEPPPAVNLPANTAPIFAIASSEGFG